MKTFFGVVAVFVAIAGFVNFFLSVNTQTAVPLIVSHPLAMLSMGYLLFQYVFPRLVYPSPTQNNTESIRHLYATGDEVASGWCGGSIGALHFRGPLIGIRVFPGGILIRPILLPPVAVFQEDIVQIQERLQLIGAEVEIRHTSKHIRSPIRLSISSRGLLARALFQLNVERDKPLP